jgi:Polyketide cyclase / dehydrase and lipid transport
MEFLLSPFDEAFFERAPARFQDAMEIPLPAESVWAKLVADDAFAWCALVKRVAWTSPPPFGAGTTRTAWMLGGAFVINERFFRWEEGRRSSFVVDRASVPGYRRLGDDYLVEPVSVDACRFTWTIAAEYQPLARAGVPLARLIAQRMFRDTRRYFEAR